MLRLLRAIPLALLCACAIAQNSGSDTNSALPQLPAFRSRVELVMVPVVVRDKSGNTVGGLTRDDFQLLDRGKVQVISQFSIEKPTDQPESTAGTSNSPNKPAAASAATSAATTPADTIPARFVAYVFDDIHADQSDLNDARNAADQHIGNTLHPTDRAAIFTTSGQNNLDFTDDRRKIHDVLFALRSHSKQTALDDCLPMTYYMADQIVNKHDSAMVDVLLPQEAVCADMRLPEDEQQVRSFIVIAANRTQTTGDMETKIALSALNDIVRRLSAAPGERDLILVSPGFLIADTDRSDETDLMQRAIHANITIGAVSAGGLSVPAMNLNRSLPASLSQQWASYQRAGTLTSEGTLAELADGTGGQFFHSNNNLLAGLNRVAARPEFIYLLGFSPQDAAADGKFHELKVTIRSAAYDIQARRGYYLPKGTENARAGLDIRAAVYARDEQREIPVEIDQQLSKPNAGKVRVNLATRIDARGLQFRKEDGLNVNKILIVAAVFDHNGKLVDNLSKGVDLKLKDEALATLVASSVAGGVALNAGFDLKRGTYLIRLVVTDAEGHKLTTHNVPLEIP